MAGILAMASLCWGGLGAWFIGRFAGALGLLDKPNERSSHSSVIPKGGGIGILAAFLLVSGWEGLPALWWIPAGALSVFSLVGDRVEVAPKLRLISQFVAAWVFLASQEFLFSDPLKGVILVLGLSIFLVATANFYNFMDGINGIAGITGLVGFGFLGGVAYVSGYESAAVTVPVCLAFACLGFLPFNMPRARVFMGDVGSIFLGFVFACFVVLLSQDVLDFICLASFLFPFYADEFDTIIIRIRKGENLLKAHRKHVYQLLANEKGIAHWKVSIGYGVFQAIVGLSVLGLKPLGLTAVIPLLGFWFAGFFIFSALIRRSVASLRNPEMP
jgi:Fuc2NAc and GlcNAc transferase